MPAQHVKVFPVIEPRGSRGCRFLIVVDEFLLVFLLLNLSYISIFGQGLSLYIYQIPACRVLFCLLQVYGSATTRPRGEGPVIEFSLRALFESFLTYVLTSLIITDLPLTLKARINVILLLLASKHFSKKLHT